MVLDKFIQWAGIATFAGLTTTSVHAQKQPNIVIILLDDMGYGDLSVTGASGYKTPHIDRLCNEGMRFTNFYSAQAVSSASRSGLMTGCYPNRIGFSGALWPNSKTGIHPDEVTLGEMLQEQGYYCGAIGKWHLGDAPQFYPTNNGFREYFGLMFSNDMWPFHPSNHYFNFGNLPLYENNQVIDANVEPKDQEQLTTQYTERAVRFIQSNKDRPFFLYLAHSMPHVPLYVSDKFKGKSEQGLYGDVMMEIDWSVGEVLRTLKESGLEENTLVLFTSDNGPWMTYGNHAGSTGGLRESKGSSFEGGQRVPCIVRWPGTVPAGTICNQLASAIDIWPTLAGLSGASLPSHTIDGVDILPLMRNVPGANPRKYFLYYYQINSLEAIRNERFKLVLPHPGMNTDGCVPGNDGKPGHTKGNYPFPFALYDLRNDPGERYDVQSQHPEVITELMSIVRTTRDDLGDELTGKPGKDRRPIGSVQ